MFQASPPRLRSFEDFQRVYPMSYPELDECLTYCYGSVRREKLEWMTEDHARRDQHGCLSADDAATLLIIRDLIVVEEQLSVIFMNRPC